MILLILICYKGLQRVRQYFKRRAVVDLSMFLNLSIQRQDGSFTETALGIFCMMLEGSSIQAQMVTLGGIQSSLSNK